MRRHLGPLLGHTGRSGATGALGRPFVAFVSPLRRLSVDSLGWLASEQASEQAASWAARRIGGNKSRLSFD